MKIIRRISIADEPERRELLSLLGIVFSTPGSPLVRTLLFDIEETDPLWQQVREHLPKWKTEDGDNPASLGMVGTVFSKQELNDANYLMMTGGWAHGYPQPEDDFGYHKLTYDPKLFCPCEVGKSQIAPFQMKREPKWGTKHVMQLNWVFDEFFVLPEIWESVFKPFGFGCVPVLDALTKNELRTVVQLGIKDVAASRLLGIPPEHPAETCPICGKSKYHPIVRGFFPPFEFAPSRPVCKTREWFGSGGSAWNAVVVNAEVYRKVCDHKLKGLTFVPLANNPEQLITPLR